MHIHRINHFLVTRGYCVITTLSSCDDHIRFQLVVWLKLSAPTLCFSTYIERGSTQLGWNIYETGQVDNRNELPWTLTTRQTDNTHDCVRFPEREKVSHSNKPRIVSHTVSCFDVSLRTTTSMKFCQAINLLLLIRRELFWIVYYEEI